MIAASDALIAGNCFKIVCLCQQVRRHLSQTIGQTPVIALLR